MKLFKSFKFIRTVLLLFLIEITSFPALADQVRIVSSNKFVAVPDHPSVLWREPVGQPPRTVALTPPKLEPKRIETRVQDAKPAHALVSTIMKPAIQR